MGKKQLWIIIAALIMLNCLTVAYFLVRADTVDADLSDNEAVAAIGKQKITRQQWLSEMEAKYGKSVLKDMVDEKVITEMANKYNIKIPKQDVDREYLKLQSNNGFLDKENKNEQKKWKEQIRNSLLLEELLTKDVDISDTELSDYYDNNKDLFNIPDAYHLSQIVVKTKQEAETALNELKHGSSFPALAMERSIDDFSANEGGDMGFITSEDEQYPKSYIKTAKELKKGEVSQPIQMDQGYAILKLDGKITGKKYTFKQVKEQIRRQLALQQMKAPETADAFWDEAKVNWFYGKTKLEND